MTRLFRRQVCIRNAEVVESVAVCRGEWNGMIGYLSFSFSFQVEWDVIVCSAQ